MKTYSEQGRESAKNLMDVERVSSTATIARSLLSKTWLSSEKYKSLNASFYAQAEKLSYAAAEIVHELGCIENWREIADDKRDANWYMRRAGEIETTAMDLSEKFYRLQGKH